jgi:hypothetical protein
VTPRSLAWPETTPAARDLLHQCPPIFDVIEPIAPLVYLTASVDWHTSEDDVG